MSADNFLGIYKINRRKFIGRNCWSECEQDGCKGCGNRIIFTAKSLLEAVTLAQDACQKDDYEYGYRFFNL